MHDAGSRRSVRSFITFFGLFFALTTLWSMATPLMGSPDEPAHTIKAAAVVRGQLTGEPGDVASRLTVDVPRYIAETVQYPCYAFHPETSASCYAGFRGDPDEVVAVETSAGLYNPLYYALVGWPSLVLSGDIALYAMRLMNAILVSALLAVTFSLIRLGRWRRWGKAAALMAVTPMVLFLGGVINPNGIEVASALVVFTGLSAVLRAQHRAPAWAYAVTVTAGVLLANGRSIALAWLAIVALGAFAGAGWARIRTLFTRPPAFISAGVLGLAAFFAVVWTISAGSLASGAPAPGAGSSFAQGLQMMLERTFDHLHGYIGSFGWLDRPAPLFAIIVWGGFAILLLLLAVVLTKGTYRRSVILVAFLLVVTPPLVQAFAVEEQGYIWQGRYALAVFVVLMVSAGIALDESGWRFDERTWVRLTPALLTTVVAGHVYTFFVVLRRYVVGDDRSIASMILTPEWNPPLGWFVLTVAFTVAMAALCVAVRSEGMYVFRPRSRLTHPTS